MGASADHPSSHEDSGLKLVSASDASDRAGAREPSGTKCAPGAPRRAVRLTALSVDITLNRYLDHDPRGRMFALDEDIERVREEERRNAAARAGSVEPAVSAGLQGDAIGPLVLRVRPGECLRVALRNALEDGDAASFHLHGAGVRVLGGGPASASNPEAYAAPGATVTYEWQVPEDEPEGTHYFHSVGNEREQVAHGLFGALIVEPPGSTWLDPRSGLPLRAGWDAVITQPRGPSFREFTLIYHEVGDETYQVTTRDGSFAPLVDPLSQAYRPGSRALNYRSEPFMHRLALGTQRTGRVDESLAYSSYAYGDPATPITRSYVGDPVKQRVLHGGSEVAHVHHVHGGSIRWRRQPGTEPTGFADGLDKHPPRVPEASERTDSQTLGPSEAFDVADECGSGGCQQSVGDLLYHCHIAHHYFAGMWGIWRVYNTLQDGIASTDTLPALHALPDRSGDTAPPAAVPAGALTGTTVDFHGARTALTAANLPSFVEAQLPPAGVPKGYDASVWDWQQVGGRWLGERETGDVWPGYRARAPGERPELRFDPRTGKLAFPFLRPHLAQRPPFAPGHGPSPYFDPAPPGADPPAPGASGAASLCPAGTQLRRFDVNAIRQPVPLNAAQGLLDGQGELFVLRQQAAAVRTDPTLQVPLALRANAGEDCIDILLRSELDDTADQPFSKVGLHIHFMQFDTQASDGLDAGFNYEQTVRPYRADGVRVAKATAPGATRIAVADTSRFTVGAVVAVGIDEEATFEARRITSVNRATLAFDRPLDSAHQAGELVSAEFVRYRWYPDAQFGTAYFHDHVDALRSWAHGLFGALIAEPPGSTYTDPHTRAPLLSGPIADIHTSTRVSRDIAGSFRELALFVQDDKGLNAVGRSTGSAYNLRAEPLDGRPGPPDRLFSTKEHGDPATPLLEANLGDPVVVRNLVGGTNDIHTVHVDGHWFRAEPWSKTSPPINTIRLGISERFDVSIPAAGGPQRTPGDYLYYSGRTFKLREGSWGLVRVHGRGEGNLVPLPGRARVPAADATICPAGAPDTRVAVSSIDVPLPMLDGRTGKVFVLDDDVDAVASGDKAPQPLVVHVNVGDCLHVKLTNRTSSGPTSYHVDLLAADPTASGGVAAGREPQQSVAPGTTRTSTFFASPEVGETVAMVRDFGDVLTNPGLGLYGAVIVGAPGTTYRGEGWSTDAYPPEGAPYRDVTLFLQDEDEAIGTHRMPYGRAVKGPVGINYRTAQEDLEPLDGEDPDTPLIEAHAGDRLRLHVLSPWSEQTQVFGLEGHDWPLEPGRRGTTIISALGVGGLEAITIEPRGGAGGLAHAPGDYRYGNERAPYREAGLWGLLRVHPAGKHVNGLRPLRDSDGGPSARTLAIGALVAAVALGALRRRRSGGRATAPPTATL